MFGISKNIVVAIVALALIVLVVLFGWLTIKKISSMIEHAEQVATATERAKWQAEISRVNAEAAQKVADQAKQALAIETDANDRVNEATQAYEELRKRNEALPGGDVIGLERDRARLLPK